MPHCLEFELSSLYSGTRLPSGGIPGCLRIVFNLFVATRPLFLSHTMMVTMNMRRKMPFSSLSEMALWCPKLKYGTTFIS